MDRIRNLLHMTPSRASAGEETTTGSAQQSTEPVEVYRAANILEAQVVQGLLESNDIPVMLVRESLGTTLAVSVGALAEVRVMVPEALAPRAVEILTAQVEEAAADTEDAQAAQAPGDSAA
jgi:hypothetical protein